MAPPRFQEVHRPAQHAVTARDEGQDRLFAAGKQHQPPIEDSEIEPPQPRHPVPYPPG